MPATVSFAMTDEEVLTVAELLEGYAEDHRGRPALLAARVAARLRAVHDDMKAAFARVAAGHLEISRAQPNGGHVDELRQALTASMPADRWGRLANQIGERIILDRVGRNECPTHGAVLRHESLNGNWTERWYCPAPGCDYAKDIYR